MAALSAENVRESARDASNPLSPWRIVSDAAALRERVFEGATIRAGEALMRLP